MRHNYGDHFDSLDTNRFVGFDSDEVLSLVYHMQTRIVSNNDLLFTKFWWVFETFWYLLVCLFWAIRLENLTRENKASVTVYQVIIETECVHNGKSWIDSLPIQLFYESCYFFSLATQISPKRMVKSHGAREKIVTVLVKFHRKVHGGHHYSAVWRSIH